MKLLLMFSFYLIVRVHNCVQFLILLLFKSIRLKSKFFNFNGCPWQKVDRQSFSQKKR